MKTFEGHLVGTGLRVGIVAGRFNELIVSKLVGGALDALKRHGVEEQGVDVAWVPGAFEIPLIAKKNGRVRTLRCGHNTGCCDSWFNSSL